ncbi:MAG: leucyl/phenylalanyl-tRNA--protein transferase [Nocardioides sp.]
MRNVPIEPPPTPWLFPAVESAETDDVVAMGADLSPGTLLAAYRSGLFPMRGEGFDPMLWWSPVDRGVLPLEGFRVSRSLRQACRRMQIRVDTAFAEVIAGCADPGRDGSWIDGDMLAAYSRLHELGWAHSVEAWQGGKLVGGLYGVAVGGLFAGESMFHRVRDASKVALVGLVDVLSDRHADLRLLDVQWQTPHLESLGAVTMSRSSYLRRLARTLELPLPEAFT